MFFKIKEITPFSKVINAYCGQKGIRTCELIYNGEIIQPDQTPKDVCYVKFNLLVSFAYFLPRVATIERLFHN